MMIEIKIKYVNMIIYSSLKFSLHYGYGSLWYYKCTVFKNFLVLLDRTVRSILEKEITWVRYRTKTIPFNIPW